MRDMLCSRMTYAFAAVFFIGGCSAPQAEDVGDASAPPIEELPVSVAGSGAGQPQLLVTTNGELLLSWTARGDDGVDVFMARSDGGEFSSPVRVNQIPGSVNPITIDEMRPALAAGPGNAVAVAWTDSNFDIQLAVSEDGGTSFGTPLRVNQDDGDALQEFPSVAFDDSGTVHAVWLDPRIAPPQVEEPADLYYARVENGGVTEQNLTAEQASSVCGCCLPDLQITGEDIVVTFRNTTDAGYRDPFQIKGTIAGDFGGPSEVTAPVWEINACPIAGPIGVGGNVLWLDGSTDRLRLLESQGAGNAPKVVLADTDEWFLDTPPRRVAGTGPDLPLLLVPAVPAYVLNREDNDWQVMIDDLPDWATSAAVYEGQLIVVGSSEGQIVQSRRELSLN
jgi:hypothetical protein